MAHRQHRSFIAIPALARSGRSAARHARAIAETWEMPEMIQGIAALTDIEAKRQP
jgi:hypothetical protein